MRSLVYRHIYCSLREIKNIFKDQGEEGVEGGNCSDYQQGTSAII